MAALDVADRTAAALAEMANLAYFRVDEHRNVVELSPAMERLTGFSAAEVLGRSCLHLHRCEECLSGCGVFDRGAVVDRCIDLYRADGAVISVRKSGRVLLDANGEIVGAVEIVEPRDPPARPGAPPPDEPRPGFDVIGSLSAHAVERDRIRQALVQARYNRTEAARMLGVSRSTLWRKMREYEL